MTQAKQKGYFVAHDGGNGYMKDSINQTRLLYPSVLARILPGNEPSTVDVKRWDNVLSILDDYINHMDITTQSNSIASNGRFLIGTSALSSGLTTTGFNVTSNEGKHTSDVGIISLLGEVAYKALQDQVKQQELPSMLNVNVEKMVTALPIDEMKIPGVRQQYAKRFTSNSHVVIINNFSEPVTVHINFDKVDVQPEGVIAQYGLIGDPQQNGKYRTDGIFDELKAKYGLKSFTGKEVSQMKYTLLIDVGEGTVDVSVLYKGSPVPQINTSINMGTGNVIENAAQALHRKYPMIGRVNRQEFVAIASRGNDKESTAYRAELTAQLIVLEQQISELVKTIYAKLNSQISFIVFCGGGVKTLRSHYEQPFDTLVDKLSPFDKALTFWVPDRYTQFLNLDGLEFRMRYM